MSWIRQRQYLGLKSEVDEYLGQHAHLDSPSTLLIQEKMTQFSNSPSGTGAATEQKRMILSNFQSLAQCWGISIYCEPSDACSMQFPNARSNSVAHCLKAMLAKCNSTSIVACKHRQCLIQAESL